MNLYNVSLTWNGVVAEDSEAATVAFQQLLGTVLPPGTVLYVTDDVTGQEVEVEL